MADKIKKFLTDNKGCPLTPAATKQLFVKFLEFLVKEGYGEELEALKDGGLQYGRYIYKSEPDRFEFIGDIPVPDDYSGLVYTFYEDGLSITQYNEGTQESDLYLTSNGITVSYNEVQAGISSDGTDKINPQALVGLTHSFNELDPALKAIVDAAISTREEVACTQSQWDAIKVLLDKSLYINFNGYSLIKSYFNGINEYHFGTLAANHGEAVYLYFDTNRGMLTAEMDEV